MTIRDFYHHLITSLDLVALIHPFSSMYPYQSDGGTFTLIDNLESPVNLIPLIAYHWTMGRSVGTTHTNTGKTYNQPDGGVKSNSANHHTTVSGIHRSFSVEQESRDLWNSPLWLIRYRLLILREELENTVEENNVWSLACCHRGWTNHRGGRQMDSLAYSGVFCCRSKHFYRSELKWWTFTSICVCQQGLSTVS